MGCNTDFDMCCSVFILYMKKISCNIQVSHTCFVIDLTFTEFKMNHMTFYKMNDKLQSGYTTL